MRVLVACEFSGVVRDAFIERGHDAVSCDLHPTESPGPHYHGDVLDILADGWDLVIAHPPCQYLSRAGVRWLMGPDGMIDEGPDSRWQKMLDACAFFNLFKGCAPKVCIENPIMHGYAAHRCGKPDQIIQPWMFGEPYNKTTGLWLEGLPPLLATKVESEREIWVENVPPGADRWKVRSRTFEGIAMAMAHQWGGLL